MLLPRGADDGAIGLGQAPQPLLELAERVLAIGVKELLLALIVLPLLAVRVAQPPVDLVAQIIRDPIEHHVLEIRREVDFARPGLRELAKGLFGQRAGPVLDGAGQAVVLARDP